MIALGFCIILSGFSITMDGLKLKINTSVDISLHLTNDNWFLIDFSFPLSPNLPPGN